MKKILLCELNASEGIDESKIKAMADALSVTAGVTVIEVNSDRDHNRSVYLRVFDFVNYSVCFVNVSAPITLQISFQGFGFADSAEWIAVHARSCHILFILDLYQLVNAKISSSFSVLDCPF